MDARFCESRNHRREAHRRAVNLVCRILASFLLTFDLHGCQPLGNWNRIGSQLPDCLCSSATSRNRLPSHLFRSSSKPRSSPQTSSRSPLSHHPGVECGYVERYTEKARRAIFFARYEASQFGSPYIETEHLLLGLFGRTRRWPTASCGRTPRSSPSASRSRLTPRSREGVDLCGSSAQPRVQACAGLWRRRGGAAQPQAHRHGASPPGPASRGEILRRSTDT